MPTSVTARQGDTLDLLCWRHLGVTAGGLVEQAFELNRGLAEAGDTIAEGSVVVLPDFTAAPAVSTLETVNLWD